MFAALVVAAVVGVDFNAADWTRSLRRTFRDVQSLSVEFTITHTPPWSRPERPAVKSKGRLRVARTVTGQPVGDLTTWVGEVETDRYTLWAGKVYHRDPAAKQIIEYEPADGDPLRFAADHFQPALAVLTARPPTVRMNGGDQHYFFVRLTFPPAERPEAVDLAVPAAHHPFLPTDVPSFLRVTDPRGERWETDVLLVRVNVADGPTAVEIADPTVMPPGWAFGSMADAWKQVPTGVSVRVDGGRLGTVWAGISPTR